MVITPERRVKIAEFQDLFRWGEPGLFVLAVDDDHTMKSDERFVLADPSPNGSFTLTLPAAAEVKGKVFTFKVANSDTITTEVVTLDGAGSETIDGATTYAMDTAKEFVSLLSDGVGWHIIGQTAPAA